MESFCKKALDAGGSINFLKIPSTDSQGLGLTNPSILVVNGKILLNLRHVQYALYHSEGKQLFQTVWGPLAYLNPEDDVTLRTTNYLCELDKNTLSIDFHKAVDTSEFDVEPKWEFIGLEDARLVKWDDRLSMIGVRRDTTTNGEGRMEISKLNFTKEISRQRIEPPTPSYCEKNWMPVLDQPGTFVKWTNPTEVVRIIEGTNDTETVCLVEQDVPFQRDVRGGSQVIPYKDWYIALTHEVDLYHSEQGKKDAQYYHRFIVWDKDWKIVHYSKEFKFIGAQIEFSCGMTYLDGEFIIPFGFQDSTAYIVRFPESVFLEMVGIDDKTEKKREMHSTPSLISNLIENPVGQEENFKLGEYYFKDGHYASAVSFYLRAAEFGIEADIVYDSLIMVALCFSKLGRRETTELGLWQNAVAFAPMRPEAHFYLSLYYERRKEWHNAYAHASSALTFSDWDRPQPYSQHIDYCQPDALFQKAVAAWWIGRGMESRELFQVLSDNISRVPARYHELVQNNLTSLGSGPDPFKTYYKSYHDRLRFKFAGSETIVQNYSQTYQDMFVLSMLNGKRGGTYFEIGAADPYKGSNSALLEEFGWTGTSVEILEHEVNKFREYRKNPVIHADATTLNYSELMNGHIDYLQVDCEPPAVSFQILKMMPFDKVTFGVITFEHDYYTDITKSIRSESREFLRSKGYVLVASNIAPDKKSAYEDWWVHPDHVDPKIIETMRMDNDDVHHVEEYMLPPID